MRATMSVAPPGAYGTRIFTGFDGNLSCAPACAKANARPAAASNFTPIRLMCHSPVSCWVVSKVGNGDPTFLVRLESRTLDQLFVRFDLTLDQRVELARLQRHRIDRKLGELLLHGRRLDHLHGCCMETVKDCAWCFRRHEHAVPHGVVGIRIAGL